MSKKKKTKYVEGQWLALFWCDKTQKYTDVKLVNDPDADDVENVYWSLCENGEPEEWPDVVMSLEHPDSFPELE